MTRTTDEVARLFKARLVAGNVGAEVYPGQPGYVIEGGEMRAMAWGFPLKLKGASRPKPVNNTRSEKLASSFWRASFEHRRCIIPMTAFAEAEGPKGSKTRTWISLPDVPAFACAGLWRDSDEWGPVYSMMMTEPSQQMRAIHDRMPVILHAQDHRQWLEAHPEMALELCQPYDGELLIDRTSELWVRR